MSQMNPVRAIIHFSAALCRRFDSTGYHIAAEVVASFTDDFLKSVFGVGLNETDEFYNTLPDAPEDPASNDPGYAAEVSMLTAIDKLSTGDPHEKVLVNLRYGAFGVRQESD